MNRPIAAAPNAWTTSSVNAAAARPTLGPSSKPDSAAREEPIIQAYRRTRTGLVLDRASRSGSSTTARIALPTRAVRRNTYREAVTTNDTTVMISVS